MNKKILSALSKTEVTDSSTRSSILRDLEFLKDESKVANSGHVTRWVQAMWVGVPFLLLVLSSLLASRDDNIATISKFTDADFVAVLTFVVEIKPIAILVIGLFTAVIVIRNIIVEFRRKVYNKAIDGRVEELTALAENYATLDTATLS